MTAGHILRMTKGRPFVQLKVAVSGDGLIAPGDGAPVWVTGPDVRAYAHLLRAHADAVHGGAQDRRRRRPGAHLPPAGPRQPLAAPGGARSRRSASRRTSRCSAPPAACPFSSSAPPAATPPAYPDGVETRQVPAGADGRLDLDAVLGSLARDGVTRVLVEGGPTIASALLAADLVDEVVIARGTEPLGASGRQPFGDRGLEVLDDAGRWQLAERRMLGADTLTVHRRAGRL